MAMWGRSRAPTAAADDRIAAWHDALARDGLPGFVDHRLSGAMQGRTSWVATLSPAELLVARSHGIRPIATVSGTCWFHYGQSWTEGHAAGWHAALDRIGREAIAAGANAVVDVKLRTLRHRLGASMDYTLIGTAVRIEGLPPSPRVAVATVSALEFVRLVEADIVPVGIAVGARYDWFSGGTAGSDVQAKLSSWTSQPVRVLTDFWERIRREAHRDLRDRAAAQGNGVLAHTQFGQLLRQERDKQPPAYLGRHIVIATTVDARRLARVPHDIAVAIDMRDGLSPLRAGATRPAGYQADIQDQEGGI